MAEPEACGSEENTNFLPECSTVNQFMQQTLKAVLQATKCSNEMPAAGDDFDFYSSFQGFQDVMNIEGKRILHLIQSILKHENVKVSLGSATGAAGAADIEDKLDLLMDANDQILERVGTWLDEASGIKKDDASLVVATATPKLQASASWNKKSPGSTPASTPSFKLLSARNIQRPQMKFRDKVDNSHRPFIPIIKEKPNALQSLEESLRLPADVTPEMTEQQDFKYPHPYQFELDNLTYATIQQNRITPKKPASLEDTPCTYVKSLDQLEALVEELKIQSEIAIDLEHHSYRTFQGITCLMQLSTRTQDYLVDTLELRSDLQCLNEVFTDPKIVKVFHGADSDVEWLQRDLGLYIVNMFDTGQAARVLNLGRFSLAHLLSQYCNVNADKQYQLADWRIRPLPEELLRYAREDTHYLLYIYHSLKNELLERGNEEKNLLASVLQRSQQICAKVYKKPQCTTEGYRELYIKNKKVFNSQQLLALQELYQWRDETARMEDESYGYVLPNHMMLQICDILPREKQGVLACCNPIPPLVRQYLNEIHAIIKKAREAPLHKVEIVKPKMGPSGQQHPKYNVDSLLNCPHDLSHQDTSMQSDSDGCLLDSSLIASKSSLFTESPASMVTDVGSDGVVVVKSQPLLSVFAAQVFLTANSRKVLTDVQRKVAEIKASFASPYAQYLPDEGKKGASVLRPAKLQPDSTDTATERVAWKLLPAPVKRKASVENNSAAQPSKRSRTDLQAPATNKHIRFTESDGEAEVKPDEKTEDDKKALPQDIEIPLRFQVPPKKKKKEKVQDIDIIESVQKHLTHIRKLQEAEEAALGENPGDEKPLSLTEKIKARLEEKKRKKQMKRNKNKQTNEERNDSMENQSKSGNLKTEIAIVIDDDDNGGGGNQSLESSKEFKPYDYTEGAKKLLQGDATNSKGYYDPQSSSRSLGSKGSRGKSHHKRGQRSHTYRRQ